MADCWHQVWVAAVLVAAEASPEHPKTSPKGMQAQNGLCVVTIVMLLAISSSERTATVRPIAENALKLCKPAAHVLLLCIHA